MNSKHPASWVRLPAWSRPAFSALAVLVTVAIAGHGHCPGAGSDVLAADHRVVTDALTFQPPAPHAAEVK